MKNAWLHRLGSVKLGIIVLLLVALAVVAGTLIVQKPLAEPGQLEQLYSPSKLKLYETLGLLDLFHAWWFTALLLLMMVNITAASVIRLPVVWREVRRHREPDEELMRAMPLNSTLRVPLESLADALHRRHYRVKLGETGGRPSLTAEKQRYARLAPYFVHLSLLVILLGGVIDSRWGYRAFMRLNEGEQKNQALRLVSDAPVSLPYAIRCDAAGMEQYSDGSPKRYWSKLAVVENGRDVLSQEIEVNSPLVYRGLRFFQSSYGRSGQLQRVQLAVSAKSAGEMTRPAGESPHGDPAARTQDAAAPVGAVKTIELSPGSEAEVPELGIRLRIAAFYPDFYLNGSQVATRSEEPNNPALKLIVTKGEQSVPVWVFPNFPQFSNSEKLPVKFGVQDLQLGAFTGLQVTRQPGQWLVWLGCTVLAAGFFWAFFFAHRQFWALELGAAGAAPALLVSAMTSKHHEEFRDEFRELIESAKES